MSQEEDKQEQQNLIETFSKSRVSIFLQTTSYTLILMTILGGLGYFLDQATGKSPLFLIIGLALGFPLTEFIIYKKFKSYAQKKAKKN